MCLLMARLLIITIILDLEDRWEHETCLGLEICQTTVPWIVLIQRVDTRKSHF